MKDWFGFFTTVLMVVVALTAFNHYKYKQGYADGFERARTIACDKTYAPYYEELCP